MDIYAEIETLKQMAAEVFDAGKELLDAQITYEVESYNPMAREEMDLIKKRKWVASKRFKIATCRYNESLKTVRSANQPNQKD